MINLDPKKMQALMKQMGMSQEEISASKVTIEKSDNTKIVINEPQVIRINVQGKDSFQVSGDVEQESAKEEITQEDIKQVMEKTGCTQHQAKEVLESVDGNLAEAILELSS